MQQTDQIPQAESANPAESIHGLATGIQSLCSQMRSLGDAIADDAFHHGCSGANAYNFATLIMRVAEEAAAQGEEVEKLAIGLKLAGAPGTLCPICGTI